MQRSDSGGAAIWWRYQGGVAETTEWETDSERCPFATRSRVRIGQILQARPCSGPLRPGTGRAPGFGQHALVRTTRIGTLRLRGSTLEVERPCFHSVSRSLPRKHGVPFD